MKVAIYWFRKSLRLHDNPALVSALKSNPDSLIPIFFLDPHFVFKSRVGIRRWIFLLESLLDLDSKLRQLDSRLLVIRGCPKIHFPVLLKSWKISSLYYERELEPYAVERDRIISEVCRKMNVAVHSINGHTLFVPEKVLEENGGKAPLTLTSFLKSIRKLNVEEPLEAPSKLPAIGNLIDLGMPKYNIDNQGSLLISDSVDLQKVMQFFESYDGPNHDFAIPELTELGFKTLAKQDQSPHRGGETNALKLLHDYFQNFNVAAFEKPNTSPAQFAPASTTVLSPHLMFGSLSCRLFYQRLQEVYKRHKNHTDPPVSLLGQLYWREFFMTVSSATPNFDKMAGNPICLQIPWKLKDGSESGTQEDKAHLEAWTKAKTGYPWIDAIMTQLRKDGWVHHLARHSVACFLTRGDLYISWERGRDVFDELLLDSDWALNNANWMWLSASAFFTQYFRVYSPVAFGKKWDKDGKYIRKYVPALAKMPTQYIFEPWKAPLSIQKQSGCVIGVDYPFPIVEHETISKINMEKMKAAYARGAKGSDSDIRDIRYEEGDVVHEEVKESKKRTKKSMDSFFNKKVKN